MQISCTQMHPFTLFVIVVELTAIGAQSVSYLNRLRDHNRLWNIVLLLLLLIFNIANGLLPDETYRIPIHLQHIIVNGIGFAILSHFPFYFYRGFGLKKLRFLAIYGVPLFIILPYLVFFVFGYSIHGDLVYTHRYGYILPTCFTFILLFSTGKAIWNTYPENKNRSRYVEEVAAYLAIIPWAFLAPVVYFQWGQLINGELIRQAEEYCKNLPPIEYPADKYMDAFSVNMDLEHYIDQQLYKYIEKKETAKFNTKLNKSMLKGIVYGVPNQSYGAITFNLPLVNVLAHPKGPQTVLQAIKDKILPRQRDGNKLLNTNIPESIIKAAGLIEEQYVKPTIQNIRYGTIPDMDANKNNRER